MAKKDNAVVRAAKTVAKHANVKAAAKKVDEILAELPPEKPKDGK